MDLVAACRAFVAVADAGSFTLGAVDVGIPQSVASRRVAALEQEIGGRLIDRTGRRAVPTPFGDRLLPRIRRLVQLADALPREAARARAIPFRMALPLDRPPAAMARLIAAGQRESLVLDLQAAGPAERRQWLRDRDVEAAVIAVPQDQSHWQVPLGLAGLPAPAHSKIRSADGGPTGGAAVRVESLRPGRRSTHHTRIWIGPEDDTPLVRDPLLRRRDATGLARDQVQVATSLAAAAAEVFTTADLVLCSASEATGLGLHWSPIADLTLVRALALSGVSTDESDRVARTLTVELAHVLGADALGAVNLGADDLGADDLGAVDREGRAPGTSTGRTHLEGEH